MAGKGQLQCHICKKTLTSRTALIYHVKGVHECLRDFKCNRCDKAYVRQMHLDRHKRLTHNHKSQNLRCHICKKKLSNRMALNCHVKGVHDCQRDFKCSHCDKAYTRQVHLDRHVRVAHKKRYYHESLKCPRSAGQQKISQAHKCSSCGIRFKQHRQLLEHNRSCPSKTNLNGRMDEEPVVRSTRQQRRATREVSQGSHQHDQLKNNISQQTPQQKLGVAIKGQDDIKALKSGDEPLHMGNRGAEAGQLQCHICKKTLSSRVALIYHIKGVHESQRDFKCSQCYKAYTRQVHLDRHIRVAHKKRYYHESLKCSKSAGQQKISQVHKCSLCRIRFKQHHQLLKHTRSCPSKTNFNGRIDEEPVMGSTRQQRRVVREANQAYHQQDQLQSCISQHHQQQQAIAVNGEDNFKDPISLDELLDMGKRRAEAGQLQCPICKKTIASKIALNNHVKVCHECPSDFKCHQCDLAFVNRDNLHRHVKWVHELKDYEQSHIDRRQTVRTDVSTIHKCNFCGKGFKQQCQLLEHTRSCPSKQDTPGMKENELVTMRTGHETWMADSLQSREGHKGQHQDGQLNGNKNQPRSQQRPTLALEGEADYTDAKSDDEQVPSTATDRHYVWIESEEADGRTKVASETEPSPMHLRNACMLCPKTFSHSYSLTRHIRECHMKLGGFSCQLCKKTFTRQFRLKSHIMTCHRGGKSFRYVVCGKRVAIQPLILKRAGAEDNTREN